MVLELLLEQHRQYISQCSVADDEKAAKKNHWQRIDAPATKTPALMEVNFFSALGAFF
jgi:hypothetical protein